MSNDKEYSITLLFGTEAKGEYERTGKVPDENWFEENGGYIDTYNFQTEQEYNAFMLGIEKAEGWGDITAIEANPPFLNNSNFNSKYYDGKQ